MESQKMYETACKQGCEEALTCRYGKGMCPAMKTPGAAGTKAMLVAGRACMNAVLLSSYSETLMPGVSSPSFRSCRSKPL